MIQNIYVISGWLHLLSFKKIYFSNSAEFEKIFEWLLFHDYRELGPNISGFVISCLGV